MESKLNKLAPDFKLKDQHNEDFVLSKHKGKRILLSFHPLAWTKICAKQMKALEKEYDTFLSLNTIPVGLSIDHVPTKHAWAKKLGLKNLRILADFWPHGKVAKLYDLFREEEGFSQRANIIIDENGKIVFKKIYQISELPDIKEILDFLDKHK
jgi:peroxiredoxin